MNILKNDTIAVKKDICLSRKNILTMLDRRGYNIDTYADFTNTELEILMEQDQLNIETHKKDDENKTVIVKYLWKHAKIKTPTLIKEINSVVENVNGNKQDLEIVIISKDKKSESLQKVIDGFNSNKQFPYIQYFWIKTFMFDIMEHEFVPKHTILSDEEKDNVRIKYNIQNNLMPVISKNDAVAQYLGMRTGDICEIVRKSETCGDYLTYRICI